MLLHLGLSLWLFWWKNQVSSELNPVFFRTETFHIAQNSINAKCYVNAKAGMLLNLGLSLRFFDEKSGNLDNPLNA